MIFFDTDIQLMMSTYMLFREYSLRTVRIVKNHLLIISLHEPMDFPYIHKATRKTYCGPGKSLLVKRVEHEANLSEVT